MRKREQRARQKVAVTTRTRPSAPTPVTDAVSALVNLGYRQAQASDAVAAAARNLG
jgi:Holliday junction resolvasome RuvABC DNA-binding subunit